MNRLPRPDAFAAILRPLRLMIPACLLLLLATACKDDPQVHLTGDIKGLQQPEILAYGFRPDTCRLLSLPQHGGDFQADFLPDSLQPFVLILDGKTEIPLFAEGGDEVRVTGDVRHPEEITVTGGSDINEDLNRYRKKKQKPEDFIRKHPDHFASAWLLINLATCTPGYDAKRLESLHKLLTPRLAQHPALQDVRNEFGRAGFQDELQIPHFGRAAHVTLPDSATGQMRDTVLTNEQLNRAIRKLAGRPAAQ